MAHSSFHEAIWETLPEGLEPSDARLRTRWLLARVAAAEREPSHPSRVLDVGCGEGYFTAALAGAGADVVGVDVAREALRRARERHPELDLRALPAEGSWPLEDASFDVAWAGETIEHVADTAAWLSEVRRVLRPAGTLLLSTPAHGRGQLLGLALSRRRFAVHFDPRGEHLRFYSAATLRALLEDFRFEQIRVRAAGGVPLARRVLLASARRGRY
ncbi:MAG TPA: class I SAM-dependent methyltransferase [Solirubrobacteraceae bacterium]|jgi:SAM-dependent methyltransferase|nr:class I SAM-dependent methyltransferase [Solirubrobacteraceae bacterium]